MLKLREIFVIMAMFAYMVVSVLVLTPSSLCINVYPYLHLCIRYANVYYKGEIGIKFKCTLDRVCRRRLFALGFVNTVSSPSKKVCYNEKHLQLIKGIIRHEGLPQ